MLSTPGLFRDRMGLGEISGTRRSPTARAVGYSLTLSAGAESVGRETVELNAALTITKRTRFEKPHGLKEKTDG